MVATNERSKELCALLSIFNQARMRKGDRPMGTTVQCANLLYYIGTNSWRSYSRKVLSTREQLFCMQYARPMSISKTHTRIRIRVCSRYTECHISRKKYVLTFILIFITSNRGLCAINQTELPPLLLLVLLLLIIKIKIHDSNDSYKSKERRENRRIITAYNTSAYVTQTHTREWEHRVKSRD